MAGRSRSLNLEENPALTAPFRRENSIKTAKCR
jgi:hypothetical protein